MAEVSKPYKWSDVPSDSVQFKTASRQNTGSVRVELELDRTQTGTWESEVAKDPDQPTVQKVRIQTPRFKKFTVKEWPAKQGGQVSYSGSFTLGDLSGPGLPAKFANEWVEPMERRVIESAASKSIEWFKKSKSIGELEQLFSSAINRGGVSEMGREYGPLMKCKLPFQRGKFRCQFYKGDASKPSSLAEYLRVTQDGREPAECIAIIDFESVWFMGRNFGVTPVLSSLLYFQPDRLTDFSFIEETPEEAEKRGPADAFLDDGPIAKRPKLTAPDNDDS